MTTHEAAHGTTCQHKGCETGQPAVHYVHVAQYGAAGDRCAFHSPYDVVEPKRSVWAYRHVMNSPASGAVTAYRRVHVQTHGGRDYSFESIRWDDGYYEVTAYEFTVDGIVALHRWANFN